MTPHPQQRYVYCSLAVPVRQLDLHHDRWPNLYEPAPRHGRMHRAFGFRLCGAPVHAPPIRYDWRTARFLQKGQRSLRWLLALSIVFATGVSSAADLLAIGAVEDVILLPWRVRLPARIDTGAARSSLGAQELAIHRNIAEFQLPNSDGRIRVRLPIIGWSTVKTSDGTMSRPLVTISLCLGARRIRSTVSLDDRSHLEYPFLVGRRTLKGRFVVDVSRSHVVPPDCVGSEPD